MASEQFSLCWDNFHKNMSSGMNSLLESEDLVDVTLAVEGKYLKAHKMVLSVCSPYFRELFKVNPCKHPIVFLKDVSYVAMSDLLQFMYQGEVQVSQENLTTFIKTAEALQIKGLTGDGNGTSEGDADLLEDHQQPFKADTTTPKPALTSSSTRQKRTQHSQIITPSNVKKPRVSSPPITSKQTLLTSKSEVATPASSSVSGSITPATELIQFKMEPSENVHGHSTITSEDVEQDFDDTLDDTGDETNEEYAMMEGGDEEPQAGTSAEGTAAAGEGQENSQRGPQARKFRERAICVDGFTYHHNTFKQANKMQYLVCAEYKRLSCKARAQLPVNGDSKGLLLRRGHNHPPFREIEVRDEFLTAIKAHIEHRPTVPLKDIYDSVSILYPGGAALCPLKKIGTSMRRWRQQIAAGYVPVESDHAE